MWFDKMLYPFKVAVAWVMVRVHDILVFFGMDDGSGPAWVLSIIGLTIIVRIIIFPLFFRQIKASRAMQAVQPELKKIQEKYRNKKDMASRQKMSEEMSALYREHGTTPFSSCLPVLLQMPVFFALFRVLGSTSLIANGTYTYDHLGPLDATKAADIEGSHLFTAPLSASFVTTDSVSAKIMIVVMVLLMAVTQFITMRQLMMKNMPASAQDPDNPMMRTQQTMMYMMPVIMGISGFFFQTGVLIYWFTTNMWTMGQQFWTIERMPTPGSDAYTKLVAKRRSGYVEWSRPIFARHDEEFAGLDTADEEARAALVRTTLASIKAGVKKFKVPSKFPVEVSEEAQLSAYRELAFSDWDGLPDERWTKRFVPKRSEDRAVRVQPQRLSKRQRQEARDAHQRREDRRQQAQQRQVTNADLTPEEIEARREQRRRERRAAAKRRRK